MSQLSEGTEVLLVLFMILFAGFVIARLINTLNLLKVSSYILAEILIEPYGLNLIPVDIIGHMGFVSDMALALIASGVGKFSKKEVLLRTGRKTITTTVLEALTAEVLMTLAVKVLFGLDWDFALILGTIATVVVPAGTVMTINQYKAEGEFVDTLLQTTALDSVACLLAFSVVAVLTRGHAAGAVAIGDVVMPAVYNLLTLVLGFFCDYPLGRLLIPARGKDNQLVLAIVMLLGISGICTTADISPLLSCMVFGAVYISLTRDKKLCRQVNNSILPIMSVFFIVSGANLDTRVLTTVETIGATHSIVRTIRKYLGTYVSCPITGTSREIRSYMGLALTPQAGVVTGLALLGQRMLSVETGNLVLMIILSSSVLYEMVGLVCAKLSLFLSGATPMGRNMDDISGEGEESETEEGGIEDTEEDSIGKPDGSDTEDIGIVREINEMSDGVKDFEEFDIEEEVVLEKAKKGEKNKKR